MQNLLQSINYSFCYDSINYVTQANMSIFVTSLSFLTFKIKAI